MRRFLIVFAILFPLPALTQADDVLPLAHGRFSITFPLPATAAPIAQGATVKFMVGTDTSAPRELRAKGVVLGSLDDVVFVEASKEQAGYLARLRETNTIKLQTIAEPDPDLIADRWRAAEAEQPVTIAPQARQLVVPVAVSGQTVERWSVGDLLIFPDAGIETFWDWQTRATASKRADVTALFVSAEPLDDGQFNLTVIVDPEQANTLLQTSLRSELTVRDETATPVEAAKRHRCYIRHRRGSETARIEIPCTD
ncbi:MAG: hypothetical protein ACU0GG_11515 [Paracoccaceae bacterium]